MEYADDLEHTQPAVVNDENSLQCKYCLREFSRTDSLKRHIESSCKVKLSEEQKTKELIDVITNERNQLIKEREQRDAQVNEMIRSLKDELNMIKQGKSKKISVGNVNSNNTITNNSNNTLNIQLVAAGKEDKSRLTNVEICKLLSSAYYSVPNLIKLMNFDVNKPENHNMYISNDRSNLMLTFNGDRWIAVDRTDTIRNLFDDGRNFLIDKVEEIRDSGEPIPKRMVNAINKFERFDNDIDDQPKKKTEIFNEIRRLLYNGRDIPINTRKLTEDRDDII